MATSYLWVDGAGDETAIEYQEPDSGSHYDKVDEHGTPDGEATYVRQNSLSYARDLYTLTSPTVSGVINYIRVVVAVWGDPGSYVKTAMKTGGTVYDGSAVGLGSLDTPFTRYDLNPKTGLAWTWDDLIALQAGQSLAGAGEWGNAYCTMTYIEIDYTASTAWTKSLTDGSKAADSVSKVWTILRTLTDGSKAADSVSKVWTILRTLTDGSKAADVVARTWTILKTLTDGSKAADVVARTWTILKTLTDGSKIADIFVSSLGFVLSLTDGSKIADGIRNSIAKRFVEGSKIADSVSHVWVILRTLTDGSKIADSISHTWVIFKTLLDGSKVVDTTAKVINKLVADGSKIADTIRKAFTKPISDGSKIADSISKAFIKGLLDGSKIADALTKVIAYARTFTEGVKVADTISKVWHAILVLADDAVKITEGCIAAMFWHSSGAWSGAKKWSRNLITGEIWGDVLNKIPGWVTGSKKMEGFTKTASKIESWIKKNKKEDDWE